MKILLSIIIILLPFSILAKQICIAPGGCKIEMDTGFCPKCEEVEELPIIKEEKVLVKNQPELPLFPRVNERLGKKVKTKKVVCYVKPCDWLQPPSNVSQSKDRKPIKRERNWVGTLFECIVGCKENVKYWDEGNNEYDTNLNLLSTN